jgi:hypothetical protein
LRAAKLESLFRRKSHWRSPFGVGVLPL